MNLLTIDNVTKAYGEKLLLRDVVFSIEEGEKIGLLGINGSGKSTLLKLAAGLVEPDGGEIVRAKGLRLNYLSQTPAFQPGDTVMDTVLQGDSPALQVWQHYRELLKTTEVTDTLSPELLQISGELDALDAWHLESDAQTLLTRLGILHYADRMAELSGGQRKRVALAAALMNPADLLILDEPTNHLDNRAIDWLERYLQRYGGALLMVTHDRYFLERVTRRIVEVENASLYSYTGNYSQYLEHKLEREENEAALAHKQRALLRKELAWMQRGARARTTKQKARIQRFDELQANMVRSGVGQLEISSAASRLGKKTISAEGVTHSLGGETIVRDFSLMLARDDRVGVIGPNGIGKSTLLRLLGGELSPDTGRVETGSTVKIGYFPQESSGLPDEMRVIDYIREAGEYLTAGKKLISAAQMLETFLFPPAAQWTALKRLSGGEKRRLHLLRILMEAPNILLLDEPGNDLDIDTLTILEDYLDDFPGAVVAVSHDRYFLDRICQRILAMEGPGIIKEYPGNYSDYLLYTAEQTETPAADRREKPKGQGLEKGSEEKARPLKFSFKEQKEFAEIDDKVTEAEEELRAVNARIEAAASDYQLLQELLPFREEAEQRLDYLLERWTYLNELAEAIARPGNQ